MTIYQIDAFADRLFTGNPAAVVPLESWIDADLMQKIAMENNLAETAFFIKKGNEFEIRWFTPAMEIDLCGHATLASGYLLFNEFNFPGDRICFHSKSGPLYIIKKGNLLQLDFPSWNPERIDDYPAELLASLGSPEIAGVYRNREYIVELLTEDAVRNLEPDFSLLKKVDRMVIITAAGKKVDFVSRFFAPNAGIDEDPVTGSAHSQLIPFWSFKLGKKEMVARQLSKRGGTIYCEHKGDRVLMGGRCILYMQGELYNLDR